MDNLGILVLSPQACSFNTWSFADHVFCFVKHPSPVAGGVRVLDQSEEKGKVGHSRQRDNSFFSENHYYRPSRGLYRSDQCGNSAAVGRNQTEQKLIPK
jgi:hypothetical protein